MYEYKRGPQRNPQQMKAKHELIRLEGRAQRQNFSMREVCIVAGKHPTTWYRARRNGKMSLRLYRVLLSTIEKIEGVPDGRQDEAIHRENADPQDGSAGA